MIVMRNKEGLYIFLSRMVDNCTLVAKGDREHYLNISIDEVVKFYVNKGYKVVN